MLEDPRQDDHATEADKDPEDLRILFDRIDDHLSFWNVLYNDAVVAQDAWQPVPLEQVGDHSDWLKMDSAPLFPSAGAGGVRGLAYRLLNLPLKLFGNPQIRFNRRLRDYLHELLLALRQMNQKDAALNARIEQNAERIRLLEAENAYLHRELEELAEQVGELRAQADPARREPEKRG